MFLQLGISYPTNSVILPLTYTKREAAESWQGKCIDSGGTHPHGGVLMETQQQDWRVLSKAASREQDPEKLIELVQELNRALLRRELESRRRPSAN